VLDEIARRNITTCVVATGSFGDDDMIGKIIAKGAKYYMIRPVSPEILDSRIQDTVRENKSVLGELREKKASVSIDERISNIFISIGIPPHIKGYAYLREGIKLAIEDPSVINNVTKVLYPHVAEKFETSPSKVERAIRHAIEVAWNRGRVEAINAIFGVRVYIGTEKPTNSEFIALVADKLILEAYRCQ
ncbi:MAG: sporulation initiation factor Spo0A C-terminal domain-containing protein, partial [Christensenellaceae bacterium]